MEGDRALGGIAAARASEAVLRLDHMGYGIRPPPPIMAQRAERGVGGDPVHPGPQGRPVLEAVEGLPRPQIRLLHKILGVAYRTGHTVTVGEQLPPVRRSRRLKLLVPRISYCHASC